MSIGYVGKAFVMNTVAGTAVNVPMPSTVAADQKLYVVVGSIGSNAGTVTAPAGWTKVFEEPTGSNLRTVLYSKKAVTADAGATYTWTFPSSGRTFGYALAYSGVDPDAVDLAQAASFTTGGTGPWAAPALALSDGDWLLTGVTARENPGTSSVHDWSIGGGAADTERYDLFTDVGTSISLSAAVFDSAGPAAAGSSARTLTSSLSNSQVCVWVLRLPAAGVVATQGGNPWSIMGIDAGIVAAVAAPAGGLSAGADAALTTTQTFTRTATEPAGATVTARRWEIMSGPLGTGQQIGSTAALSWKPGSSVAGSNDIRNPTFQELAFEMTSTAENSTLDWTTAYGYIEDIKDNRGYTAGLVGFCSGTGDMLQVVQQYAVEKPGNALAGYISGLQKCVTVGFGTGASAAATTNLGAPFITAWKAAASGDPIFRKVQRDFRKNMYWNDALVQALADGVGPLGLAIYYDVLVNHGVGSDSESFGGILAFVRAANTKPAAGGNMTTWLKAVIDRRDTILKGWGDDQSVDGRVFMHRLLLNGGTVGGAAQAAQLNLTAPFKFTCYGDLYTITARPDPAADALLGTYVLRYTATGAGTDDVAVTVS